MTKQAKYWLNNSDARQKEIRLKIAEYLLKKEVNEKELIQEIVDLKSEALVSAKLKDEFLAQVSHEIRTPLNIITNYTELLKDELKARGIDEEFKEFFKAINKGSERIVRTIELILNYAQIKENQYSPHFEELNVISDVIMPVIDNYNYKAQEKGLMLNLDVTECKKAEVKLDLYSSEQVISHILDNAIKYTERGEVKVKVFNKDSVTVIEITDTGIGISDEYLEHICTPFMQEESGYNRSYDGNGLGLALVKKYCELNKIKMKIESKKSKGTLVRLLIPAN